MNEIVVRKAKDLQKKMLKYIDKILKSMTWSFIIPHELLTKILDFICYSFLRPPCIFFPVPVPCPFTPNTQYILESQSTITILQTHSEWRSIKSFNILQVRLAQKRFIKFIKDSSKQRERPHFIGFIRDVELFQRIIIHIRERGLISITDMEGLKRLMNKNIICIRNQGRENFIIENRGYLLIKEAMYENGIIYYDAKKEIYMIYCVRIWQKGTNIPRKKGIVRLSRSILVEIQDNEVKQLPMNYFDQKDPKCIAYLLP